MTRQTKYPRQIMTVMACSGKWDAYRLLALLLVAVAGGNNFLAPSTDDDASVFCPSPIGRL